MSDTSNRLPVLAAEIKQAKAESRQHAAAALARAIDAGVRLIEAKQHLKHGQWLPWLKEHAEISERTAQVYMALAREKDAVTKSAEAADLSIEGALQMVRAQQKRAALAKKIGEDWAKAEAHMRQTADHIRAAFERFKAEGKGDSDAFVLWLRSKGIHEILAQQVPTLLLAAEYDRDAWAEAFLDALEACAGDAGKPAP